MWEMLGAIGSTISAVCDVRSIRGQSHQTGDSPPSEGATPSPSRRFDLLVKGSVAWCLLASSYLLIEQPCGSIITDRELKEIIGWFVAGPAFLFTLVTLSAANTSKSDATGISPDKNSS